jgi:hypothetical protein
VAELGDKVMIVELKLFLTVVDHDKIIAGALVLKKG